MDEIIIALNGWTMNQHDKTFEQLVGNGMITAQVVFVQRIQNFSIKSGVWHWVINLPIINIYQSNYALAI